MQAESDPSEASRKSDEVKTVLTILEFRERLRKTGDYGRHATGRNLRG